MCDEQQQQYRRDEGGMTGSWRILSHLLACMQRLDMKAMLRASSGLLLCAFMLMATGSLSPGASMAAGGARKSDQAAVGLGRCK